jgi:L-alanine-DL-glutamate epimerase-like enolase superfamily enzyme
MRISRCDVWRVKIPLVKPFVIATATMNFYEGVLLRLKSSDGLEGWGESAPSPAVTQETPPMVERQLKAASPKLLSLDPLETSASLEIASRWVRGPAALAAVDIALHDLKCRHYSIPLCRLLGGFRKSIATSVTVSIRDEDETLRQAEELVKKGFEILKIKIGTDPESDIARLRRLRGCLGSRPRIRVDANQGYSVSDALRVLRGIYGCDVEFCEQPVPKDDLRALARVRRSSPVPIMADESVRSPSDLLKIIQLKAADMVNLKLMKSGGLRGAQQLARIAEAAGMPCQMGCMIETRLGITAATHLALAEGNIRFADLDGHLELASDPSSGGVRTSDGENRVRKGPGLGISVRAPAGIDSGG